ncbi:MAG: DNA-3-methyladenine glycosylase [Anaerolineaceae bacterium]|nr:DNA-3-methyladenine glycosylase [Anaerolineaceae bacterium]
MILPREFYTCPAYVLAPQLLGCRLVRILDGVRLEALICEAEAYQGQQDQACHARKGCTPRCQVMFGPPGHAYIYFTYGMHWMLNLVCEQQGFPAAVLIRAVYPLCGLEKMTALRPHLAQRPAWLDGPAKLSQALGLDRAMNGADLCTPDSGLFVEEGLQIPKSLVNVGPRVGINYAPEPWLSMPWRWKLPYAHAAELVTKKWKMSGC